MTILAPEPPTRFNVEDYLQTEREKDLLRFSTAGSVDDGKSTLIGRLLYDTQSVYDDQLLSIAGKGTTQPGVLDLALLTDGLRAEREQGITIDVAYRYFATARRKFIIADTPGHEQYTRNMATGASTASAAIVLIDARKGVLPQSRRHAYITALLGVRHIIVAVNKMDLVDYAETVFTSIREAFTQFFASLAIDGKHLTTLHFIPVSALVGDNVVHPSAAMPWYSGPTLLGLLESLPSSDIAVDQPFRMAVQRVARPNLDFRGFAGQIASGTLHLGDAVQVLPSGRTSRVTRIVTYDGDIPEAFAPQSITLTLADELDISRGDLLVTPQDPAPVSTSFTASLVWMDATPLDLTRRYTLKHTARSVQARVPRLLHTVQLGDLIQKAATTLALNEIGTVEIETLQPIAADTYAHNRTTGSLVLIDTQSNATVAAGMILRIGTSSSTPTQAARVTSHDRAARYGHKGALITLSGTPEYAQALERALFDRGANVYLSHPELIDSTPLLDAGLLVILPTSQDTHQLTATLNSITTQPADQVSQAVEATLTLLKQAGVFHQEF